MSVDSDGWQGAVAQWARQRPDIRALVQIGSRVQQGSSADAWSDYDYHLVTTRPQRYRSGAFCAQIASCWAFGAETAFGNALKVSAVYEGGLEADFVVLRHLDLLVAATALRWPSTRRLWPRRLLRGVADLRIVAGPGWRVIKGGEPWTKRYGRIAPLREAMTPEEFSLLCGNFWTQAVWAAKKAQRGEFRASQRAVHTQLLEACLRVLQEEAILEGRRAYPLGRRAELWLSPERLRATSFGTAPEREALHRAIRTVTEAFLESSCEVASRKGWPRPDYAQLRSWLGGLL
jgi:hypothetical protein